MIKTTRRGLITGLGALLAAPAIVRATSIMPVKAWVAPRHEVVICAPDTNPISGPWQTYPVAPGAAIYRGDLVVLGTDGYVRPARNILLPLEEFEAQYNHARWVAGTAVTDSAPQQYQPASVALISIDHPHS